MSDLIQDLCKELARIEEDALYSMKGHYNASSYWNYANNSLSLLGAILATIAGITSFTEIDIIVKISAIGSAFITSILAFLECSKKSENHRTSGSSFSTLKDRARNAREIKSKILDDKDLIILVDELIERKNELNSISLQIPRRAYEKAKRDIEAGHAKYQIDNKGEK